MPPEVITRAFDPFFTTKPIGQGTGLGLSMVYGFARQSGGQVRIYSEVGQGTMVCLYLPRHRGTDLDEEIVEQLSEAPRAKAGETVLIIDDEPTIRMLVTEVLEELGYTAIEAVDGASGLKVLQSDARVDLLVTDVGLPNGMNGRQVADAARVLRPKLKVLFITGYAENAVLNHGHPRARHARADEALRDGGAGKPGQRPDCRGEARGLTLCRLQRQFLDLRDRRRIPERRHHSVKRRVDHQLVLAIEHDFDPAACLRLDRPNQGRIDRNRAGFPNTERWEYEVSAA